MIKMFQTLVLLVCFFWGCNTESNNTITTVSCGNWGPRYAAFHKKILSVHKDSKIKKLIVAIPHKSGLADRIVGLATVFMMGLLSDRAFQIGRREGLPNLELIFDSPNINWSRLQDSDWILDPVTLKSKTLNYDPSYTKSNQYFALNLVANIKAQDRVLTKDINSLISYEGKGLTKVSVVSANKGLLSRYWENPVHEKLIASMGLNGHNAFGCIVNFLFQPKPDIFVPVKAQYDIMTPSANTSRVLKIGIQIRVGDWTWADRNHAVDLQRQFGTYFDCAQQIEDFALKAPDSAYTSTVWYLTTESMPLRRAAVERYGSKILTALNISVDHSAKESSVCKGGGDNCTVSTLSFATAAAEWWLLGLSDYFVISRFSGYGRTAGFRSQHTDRIYTVNHGSNPKVCDAKSFTTLETHAFDWSGI